MSVTTAPQPTPPPPPTTHSTQQPLPPPFHLTTPPPTLLTQGAEALVYRTHFLQPSRPACLKVRPSKSWRHPTLDARLTRQRVLSEARVLVKLSGVCASLGAEGGNALRDEGDGGGFQVPGVLAVEWDLGRRVKGLEAEQRVRAGDASAVSGTAADADASSSAVKESTEEEATGVPASLGPRANLKVMKGAWLLMEWIEGDSVKELLRRWDAWFKARPGSAQRSGGSALDTISESQIHRDDASDASDGRAHNRHDPIGTANNTAVVVDTELSEQLEQIKQLLRRIGRAIGLMHSRGGVVHGDLTTSNIMVRAPRSQPQPQQQQLHTIDAPSDPSSIHPDQHDTTHVMIRTTTTPDHPNTSLSPPDLTGAIVLIDFGLSTQTIQDEDRAVDLYVLERAFGSTHPLQEALFDAEVLQHEQGYRGSFKGGPSGAGQVLRRLEEVRLRGRKRSMVG